MSKATQSLADEFAPAGYKLPETSSYMKFQPGKNKFRILSPLVTGYEYWTEDNKVVRSRTPFEDTPGIKKDDEGKSKVAHFWALVVWNYDAEAVQLLEITQKGIQKYILEMLNNPDWGSPMGYDIVVTREGAGFDTKYTTVASPHKEVAPEILDAFEQANIDVEALMFPE